MPERVRAMVGWIVRQVRIRALRVRYGLDYGRLVRERLRFALNEGINRWRTGRYHLRDGGMVIAVRHHPSPHGTPSNDTWVVREIFRDGPYEVPDRVPMPLAPRVVDLGANIGLFTTFMLTRYPAARIVAFEPDAENAALLREMVRINCHGARVDIREACAMTSNQTVLFGTGRHQFSRILSSPEAGAVEVPGLDIFPFLDDVDLLKMDIEGGEWSLLADPRFGAARAVVLEYHPMMCPGPDPRVLVKELLSARGYEVIVDDEPMAWAVRV